MANNGRLDNSFEADQHPQDDFEPLFQRRRNNSIDQEDGAGDRRYPASGLFHTNSICSATARQ